MHDDTGTTSWRRLTDQAKGLPSKRVNAAFAVASRALPQAARGAVALESSPTAMPHAGLVTLRGRAASSSSTAQVATATARYRTQRSGEAIQQAAQLASWESDGGTPSSEVCRTQEPCMDWDHVEASWQQFRGEVHANWGRLTPVHLDIIAGRRACLSNEIEEAYGVTSEEAERQIKSFEARNQHPRPVSFR
jgi:uncharacterized protein YjbJ (UPF0337 family)